MLQPTPSEIDRRAEVVKAVLAAIQSDERIQLPAFDPASASAADFALHTIASERGRFGGGVGDFLYQIEGEEDLLHVIVVRVDGGGLTPEEGQSVMGFLFPGLPPSLVWLKPGERSQHFYFGHDELLRD
jgi:hypothetical protein